MPDLRAILAESDPSGSALRAREQAVERLAAALSGHFENEL